MFHIYQQKNFKLLAQYCLYNYFKLVSIISNKTGEDILFTKKYPHFLSVTQHLCNASPYKTLVALFGPLSLNKADKNTIQGAHLDTDIRQNNVDMIWLGLFIFWDRLQRRLFCIMLLFHLILVFPDKYGQKSNRAEISTFFIMQIMFYKEGKAR